MRVIAGLARGRRLTSLEGLDTRPTTDRVKESIFNIIAPYTGDARVLDLFAGSGALGIEALSRGASSCMFVENSPSAMAIVRENLTATRLADAAETVLSDALQFLKQTNRQYDLILLDPPYDAGIVPEVLHLVRERALLAADGVIMLERRAGEAFPETDGYTAVSDRKYGKTAVTILKGSDKND